MENEKTVLSFKNTLNCILLRNNTGITPDIVLLMSIRCGTSVIFSLDEGDPKRIRMLLSVSDTEITQGK